MKPITLETYKELEDQGVFIEYIPEHYNDGSNYNFSIYFMELQTYTYEFLFDLNESGLSQ